MDRNYTRVLPPLLSKKARWFRTAYLNQRLMSWIFWSRLETIWEIKKNANKLSLFGFIFFYNINTLRWFGAGQRVNNLVREVHESDRAQREGEFDH